MNTITTKEKPQIYVACLAAYNEGFLHGKWIDATQSPDDIKEEIKDFHNRLLKIEESKKK